MPSIPRTARLKKLSEKDTPLELEELDELDELDELEELLEELEELLEELEEELEDELEELELLLELDELLVEELAVLDDELEELLPTGEGFSAFDFESLHAVINARQIDSPMQRKILLKEALSPGKFLEIHFIAYNSFSVKTGSFCLKKAPMKQQKSEAVCKRV